MFNPKLPLPGSQPDKSLSLPAQGRLDFLTYDSTQFLFGHFLSFSVSDWF